MAAVRRTTIIAAIALLTSVLPAPAQVPLGSEFRVDTTGEAFHGYLGETGRGPSMAPDGTFVVTWGINYVERDVLARRFDAAGVARGPEFTVNTYTSGPQHNPTIGIDDAGGFIVVWTGPGPNGVVSGVFGQRFDASGALIGIEFQVTSGGFRPALAVAPGGDFVVVWTTGDGFYISVFGKRYDASGSSAGAEFQINMNPTGFHQWPSVDVDGAGNFVVVWTHTDGVGWETFGQRFTAGGARAGTEFAVSSYTSNYRATVARSRNGSFVVSWEGDGAGDSSGVFARRFDAGGLPLGADFKVNEYTTGTQRRPHVDADADGDFVVTWRSRDGSGYGVSARRFDATGVGGSEFRVNTYTTGDQWYPSIADDPAGNFVVTWYSLQNDVRGVFAQRYAGGLSAAALAVDGTAGPTSDGNGVFEAGETVAVAPSWLNANFGAQTFTGSASDFTGPGAPGDPTYTITDSTASYGTVASGATASCASSADCYALATTIPSVRPVQHWDASFHEQIAPANLGASKNWTLHMGGSFGDVPPASAFYRFVETMLHHQITAGCNAAQYCPLAGTAREQMAVFVLVAKERAGYSPPACVTPMFADVPATSPFCRWIEELARRGVVAGCGGGNYCPAAAVTREQMAVFVLLTKEPGVLPPSCGAPRFNDVPESSPFCRWIEELARRGVVTGCGGGNYCPAAAVTREQMAVFISATFGLQLYGP